MDLAIAFDERLKREDVSLPDARETWMRLDQKELAVLVFRYVVYIKHAIEGTLGLSLSMGDLVQLRQMTRGMIESILRDESKEDLIPRIIPILIRSFCRDVLEYPMEKASNQTFAHGQDWMEGRVLRHYRKGVRP